MELRFMGIDPGLQRTGWGVIRCSGTRLAYEAHGVITTSTSARFEERLLGLTQGLEAVLRDWQPDQVAVEEVYVNKNPQSTLKLGMARGACLLAPAQRGVPVAHLSPAEVKKSVVGKGQAQKGQVGAMVRILLGRADLSGEDALDALAAAITQAHLSQTHARVGLPA